MHLVYDPTDKLIQLRSGHTINRFLIKGNNAPIHYAGRHNMIEKSFVGDENLFLSLP